MLVTGEGSRTRGILALCIVTLFKLGASVVSVYVLRPLQVANSLPVAYETLRFAWPGFLIFGLLWLAVTSGVVVFHARRVARESSRNALLLIASGCLWIVAVVVFVGLLPSS